jgi:seryl-tRNA synthetase
MMAVVWDPAQLSARLVEQGWVLPTDVPGLVGRGRAFEDIVERIDDVLRAEAAADGAESLVFPPVLPRRLIEQLDYLDSFPHLCGVVFGFTGSEREAPRLSERVHAGEPWGDLLEMTDVALTPAACYPVYPTLSGELPREGRLVTVRNWVFRHEPSHEPTRLQSFRMREFVRAGDPEDVWRWREQWASRAVALLESIGLPVRSDAAADPFFGRGGKLLAAGQRASQLKTEILVPVISQTEPTAICSLNAHQDHFTTPFDIRLPDGAPAHTACVGFGLERVALALLQHHGFRVEDWPLPVRRVLWPCR